MRKLAFAALVVLACTDHAAQRRRSVTHPSAPAKPLTSWSVDVTTSGGFAPSIRTSIALRSSGAATLLNFRGESMCIASLNESELGSLGAAVAQAHPESWAASYLRESNPTGCCDQIRTSVKLTRVYGDQTLTSESYWFDDHPALPADLSSLYDLAYGGASSPRNRIEPSCTSQGAKNWSIEITEDGGVAFRFHQVTVDSSGNVLVKPNVQSSECKYTIDESETQTLGNLVRDANAPAWASSYARPNNPHGCCDQIKTVVKLKRGDVLYSTFWYSDHPALPSDLNDLHAGALAIFQRLGPQCGPLF